MEEKLQQAMDWYNHCISLDPSYPDVNVNRAAILRQIGKPSEAAHALRLALAIQPADSLASVNLAFLDQDHGRCMPGSSCPPP